MYRSCRCRVGLLGLTYNRSLACGYRATFRIDLQMLHVWRVSGDELTAIPLEELTDVRALKRRLEWPCGCTRFRQRILHDGENLDDDVMLCGPMDVQLVLLPFWHASRAEVEELIAAADKGDLVLAESILCRPQAPDLTLEEEGVTPLLAAACQGHVETARLLLEAGAIVDKIYLGAGEPERFRRTALSVACQEGYVEMVQLLLDASGDPYLGGSDGYALFQATAVGHLDVLRLLLSEDIGTNQSRFEVAVRHSDAAAIAVSSWNGDVLEVLHTSKKGWCLTGVCLRVIRTCQHVCQWWIWMEAISG